MLSAAPGEEQAEPSDSSPTAISTSPSADSSPTTALPFPECYFSSDVADLLSHYPPAYALLGVQTLGEDRFWYAPEPGHTPSLATDDPTLPDIIAPHLSCNWEGLLDLQACAPLTDTQRQALLTMPDLLFGSRYTNQILLPERILYMAYEGLDCPVGFCIDKSTKAVGVHVLPDPLSLSKRHHHTQAASEVAVATGEEASASVSQDSPRVEETPVTEKAPTTEPHSEASPRTNVIISCLMEGEHANRPVVIDCQSNLFHKAEAEHVDKGAGFRRYADLSIPYDDFFSPCPECFPDITPLAVCSEQEQELANKLKAGILTSHKIARSPLSDELNELTVKLQRNAPLTSRNTNVIIINSPVADALATVTGDLYLTSALLEESRDNYELIAIISHELAHNELKHKLQRPKKLFFSLQFDALDISPVSQQTYSLVDINEADFASRSCSVSYSEQDEAEAALLALSISFSAGFEPQRFIEAYRTLFSDKHHFNTFCWGDRHERFSIKSSELEKAASQLQELSRLTEIAKQHNDQELALALRRQARQYLAAPTAIDYFMEAYQQLNLRLSPVVNQSLSELEQAEDLRLRFKSWRKAQRHE